MNGTNELIPDSQLQRPTLMNNSYLVAPTFPSPSFHSNSVSEQNGIIAYISRRQASWKLFQKSILLKGNYFNSIKILFF